MRVSRNSTERPDRSTTRRWSSSPRAVAALGLAATLVAASACNSSGTSVGSPTTGSVTDMADTVAPLPTEAVVTPTTRPGLPMAAREHTTAGALEYATFMVALLNQGYAAPESGLFLPYASAVCQSCNDLDKSFAEMGVFQRRYDVPPYTVVDAVPDRLDRPDGDERKIRVRVRAAGGRLVDAKNKVINTTPVKDQTFIFDLKWTDNAWWLTEIWVWIPDPKK